MLHSSNPPLNERLALIQLYQWNARVMPIAAYRKWLNCQVQSEVMTAGVEYVEGVERVATEPILNGEDYRPRGFRRDFP